MYCGLLNYKNLATVKYILQSDFLSNRYYKSAKSLKSFFFLSRILRGCYMDMDEIASLYEKMRRDDDA